MNNPYTISIRLAIALAVIFASGCRQNKYVIDEKVLQSNNPTSFVFNATIPEVQNAVRCVRGIDWLAAQKLHEGGQLLWKSDSNPFAEIIYTNKANDNDAYISYMGNSVGESTIYFKDGSPLTYYADFQIHIVSNSPTKTVVSIKTFDSHILAGIEWHPVGQAGIFLTVEPTSIEEYQILLDIGKQLECKEMPNLTLPSGGANVIKKKHDRRR
jgi:hypothetical protein